jgi:hypothetical protein
VLLVFRWVDDDTIAYQSHCGTGCGLLFELAVARPDEGPPALAGTLSEVPVVSDAAYPMNAGTLFHYSDDGRYVAADVFAPPRIVVYDRDTGERWLLRFDNDPPGVEIFREFVGWRPDGTFVYREAIGDPTIGEEQRSGWFNDPSSSTRWLADPRTRSRTPLTAN